MSRAKIGGEAIEQIRSVADRGEYRQTAGFVARFRKAWSRVITAKARFPTRLFALRFLLKPHVVA
jgi:predicted lipid-binding transport protein (Tim44 family)